MKNHLISLKLLAFTVLLMSACTKDDNMQFKVPPVSNTSVMLADHWYKKQDGIYESNFGNFYSSGKYAGISPDKVKVYLMSSDNSILISQTSIIFMSGILSADKYENDLRIYYHPFNARNELPFMSLSLKVKVE